MSPFDMQDIIREICKLHGYDLKVKMRFNGVAPMRYSWNTMEISFHPDRLITMANKMNMSIEKAVHFGTLHELGHHIDNINGTIGQDKLRNEKVAWENSRGLVQSDLLDEYDDFNMKNLETYRKRLSL